MRILIIILFIFYFNRIINATVIHVPAEVDSIQGGIILAEDGDTVLVGPGLYQESINFMGKEIVVMSGLSMNTTVIRGDSLQPVVSFVSGEKLDARLVGFTIENGNGGILCENFSNPVILNCKIWNNHNNPQSFPIGGGGGIECNKSSPLVMNSIIYENWTSGLGGGIFANQSDFKLVNCVVYNNHAVLIPESGGIFAYPDKGNPFILNSIIWKNKIYKNITSQYPFAVYYCDIEGGWIGPGNTNLTPQFVDTLNGDFHLQPTSPCIDAGNPMLLFNDANSTRNDMGAYGGSGFALEGLNIDLGEVPVQTMHKFLYKIYNLRNSQFMVIELNFSNDSTFYSTVSLPVNIPAGSVFELPLFFQPTDSGSDSTLLTMHFADFQYADSLDVKITGKGVNLHGDEQYRKQGITDKGLVRTIFINWGEVAHWPDSPSGEWPKGTGHQYLDGSAFIIQAETQDINGITIHPLETQYREFVDHGPNNELWGWLPLPGYFDPFSAVPAMSDQPQSWPTQWPNRPPGWNGHWNGFFGRGVFAADQETYFVFDDSQDQEWDFYPMTSDSSTGGLGLVVEGRGYAWTNPQLEDVLVWHYTIHNESDYDYHKVILGLYIDSGIGGTDDGNDDLGAYLPAHEMVYFWDLDGFGSPGGWHPVGMLGFKYLEMPGNPYDGLDNDGDGLTDESRDNGIDDDGDWNPLTDDVGMDGVPGTGDQGEGDGIPTSGEPNFDRTDSDESDDLTINTVRFFPVHTYELWNEDQNWQVFTSGVIDSSSIVTNLASFIISEQFPLYSGETTYFSYAMVFGDSLDDLLINIGNITNIPSTDHKFTMPIRVQLHQNYPNPFNPNTIIQFDLPFRQNVILEIYNLLGQRVKKLAEGLYKAGTYKVNWNGRNDLGIPVASGVYIYQLRTSTFVKSRKMLLIK